MLLLPCPTSPLTITQGTDQLLLQIQWTQLQRRYRLLFQRRSYAAGMYLFVGR